MRAEVEAGADATHEAGAPELGERADATRAATGADATREAGAPIKEEAGAAFDGADATRGKKKRARNGNRRRGVRLTDEASLGSAAAMEQTRTCAGWTDMLMALSEVPGTECSRKALSRFRLSEGEDDGLCCLREASAAMKSELKVLRSQFGDTGPYLAHLQRAVKLKGLLSTLGAAGIEASIRAFTGRTRPVAAQRAAGRADAPQGGAGAPAQLAGDGADAAQDDAADGADADSLPGLAGGGEDSDVGSENADVSK